MTRSGKICDPWKNSHYKGEANYCSSPDHDIDSGVWCFTQNAPSGLDWEECDVPSCDGPSYKECYKYDKGTDYRGTVSHTKSGIPCQYWNTNYPNRIEVGPSAEGISYK